MSLMHNCTHFAETPQLPPFPPHLGSYTGALLVSKDKRHLFVTPLPSTYCPGNNLPHPSQQLPTRTHPATYPSMHPSKGHTLSRPRQHTPPKDTPCPIPVPVNPQPPDTPCPIYANTSPADTPCAVPVNTPFHRTHPVPS